MDTAASLWNEYGWILPLALFLLCFVGCARGRLGGACCSRGGRREAEGETAER